MFMIAFLPFIKHKVQFPKIDWISKLYSFDSQYLLIFGLSILSSLSSDISGGASSSSSSKDLLFIDPKELTGGQGLKRIMD